MQLEKLVLKNIADASDVLAYRVNNFRLFSRELSGEDILVEFVLLAHDYRSISQKTDVTSLKALETLNKTINSGKFTVDLSGWTGKNDIFTAVGDSLQTIHLISVNQTIIYNRTYGKTGFDIGPVAGAAVGAFFGALLVGVSVGVIISNI